MKLLLDQEREARVTKNETKMTQIMSDIISNCRDDNEIIGYLRILVRRKAQLKQSLKDTLNNIFNHKSQNMDEVNIKFSIKLLQEVIEGRFYLEDERILVTKRLKEIYEERGDDSKALEVVFNVPVETFDIPDIEKINYQLEVLRLSVKTKDWNKSECVSRRIRLSFFKETNDSKYEINFYTSMIGVALGKRKFIEAAKHLKRLYSIDKTEPMKKIVYCTFFALISDYTEEKDALISDCLNCKDNVENMRRIIRLFNSFEIIPTNICEVIESMDSQLHYFVDDFLEAINVHNFKVVSIFFTKIKIEDLCIIMQYNSEKCIKLISDGVNKKLLSASIDQEKGIIFFKLREKNEAGEKIEKVLNRLMRVNHMIQKEKLATNQ